MNKLNKGHERYLQGKLQVIGERNQRLRKIERSPMLID
jgi:hypothetical protein